MQKIMVGTRILPEWHHKLTEVMTATGQSQSEVLEEAIGQYLGKVRRTKVVSRIDVLEKRMATIVGLMAK